MATIKRKSNTEVVFEMSEEEAQQASFMSWDDASLGAMVKASALTLAAVKPKESLLVGAHGCAVFLAGLAHSMNGDLKLDLDGFTCKGKPVGDYLLRVTRKKSVKTKSIP